MKLQELQILAQKVQLKLKPEEINLLLTNFSELEKLLVNFRRLKLKNNKANSYYRPKTTEISLKDLHKLSRKYSVHLIKQKTFQQNAISTSPKNFLLIAKK